MRKAIAYKIIVFLLVLSIGKIASAQQNDSTRVPAHFGFSTTVTDNGISIIPTFTLGRPALVFDLNVGSRFSFEPQLRFALDAKPWAFVLWLRYKLVRKNRFKMNIGVHPSYVFKTVPLSENGVTKEYVTTQRYLAAEFSPNYMVGKNISIGLYYLVSAGFPESVNKLTNFITVNSNFSHIHLLNDFYMRFSPQLYYLRIDAREGVYYSTSLTLAHQKSPFSFQYLFNGPFHSDIVGGQNFISNISLIYSIHKNYFPVKLPHLF